MTIYSAPAIGYDDSTIPYDGVVPAQATFSPPVNSMSNWNSSSLVWPEYRFKNEAKKKRRNIEIAVAMMGD